MKRRDKSALVFIVLGVLITFGTPSLRIGSFSRPGPGLFPLLLALLLIAFGMISFFISNGEKNPKLSWAIIPPNVWYVIGILFAYRFSLPVLGYFLSTLFLFVFLLKFIGGQRWFATMAWSILFTTFSLLLFVKWLEVPFPRGILPF